MKSKSLLLIVLLAQCMVSVAQTDLEIDPDFGGRLSFSLDKKISKGFHFYLQEEVRMDNYLRSFSRFHTTLGTSYKVNQYLKLGGGYVLINPYNSSKGSFRSSRHRLFLNVSSGYTFGNWRISAKEQFQATYRSGDMNEYQNPRTALTLKSRIKVQYKSLLRFSPFASIELRNILNAPSIKANFDGTNYLTPDMQTTGEAGWFLNGFNNCYTNRLRFETGTEYRIDKRSSIEVSFMLDRVADHVVDANSEGTRLKSFTNETSWIGWIVAGYKLSL